MIANPSSSSVLFQALVDGPAVARKPMNFKMLQLTTIVIKTGRGVHRGKLLKAWEKAEVDKKWKESSTYKKIEASKKVSFQDIK